jgi:hypothetical protein
MRPIIEMILLLLAIAAMTGKAKNVMIDCIQAKRLVIGREIGGNFICYYSRSRALLLPAGPPTS